MRFEVKAALSGLTTKAAEAIGDIRHQVRPSGGPAAPFPSPAPTSGPKAYLNPHAGRGQFRSMTQGKNDPAKMTLETAKNANLEYLSDTAPYGNAMKRWKHLSFSKQLPGLTNREKITHVMMLTRSSRPQRAEDALTALSSISSGSTGIFSKMSTIPATIIKWGELDSGTKTKAQNVLIKEAADILNTKIPIIPADPTSPVFTSAKDGDGPRPFVRERDQNGDYQFYVRYSALGRTGTFGEIAGFDVGAEEVIDGAWDRTIKLKESMKPAFTAKYSFENAKTQIRHGAKEIQKEAKHLKHNAEELFSNSKVQFAGADLKRKARQLFSSDSSKSNPPRETVPPSSTGRKKHQTIGVNQVSLEQLRIARLSSDVQTYQGRHLYEDGRLRGIFTESKNDFELGPVIDYCMSSPREMQTVQGLFDFKTHNGYLNSAYKPGGNQTEQPPYGVQLKDVQGNVGLAYKQALEAVQGRLDNEP